MTANYLCSKVLTIVVVLSFLPELVAPAAGQTAALTLPEAKETVVFNSIGFGHSTARETYLSESTYSGYSFSFEYDSWMGISPEKLLGYGKQHSSFLFSPMKNPVGGGSTYEFMWDYSFSRAWNGVHTDVSDLLIGPAAMIKLGALYNQMNSNNPVSAVANLSLGVCVDYTFRFRIKNRNFALQAAACSHLMGVAFAPDYDQPYWYMLNYGQFGKAVHFAWLGNSFAMTGQAGIVCPVRGGRIKVECTFDSMQNKLGGNFRRLNDIQCTVGYIHRFELKE